MKFRNLIFSFLLVVSAGTVTAQNIANSFTHGGFQRDYVVHLPAGYSPGTPLPLVLMLHRLGDEMNNFMLGTGFNGQSETHNFIVCYPNAVDEFGFGRAWNNTTLPFSSVNDISFVNIDYKPFDASEWPVRESGLLGPVTLTPISKMEF